MSNEIAALAERLGVEPARLDALTSLSGADVARLDAVVEAAMTAEDETFRSSMDDALRFVPRPLRGMARSLLSTGGQHE